MISYIFLSSQKSLDLNSIVQAIESSFSGLRLNMFIPSPFPSQNQTINVHGGIGISNNNGILSIQINFFEDSDNWSAPTITQNGITISFSKSIYPTIPSQSEIETILKNGGFL